MPRYIWRVSINPNDKPQFEVKQFLLDILPAFGWGAAIYTSALAQFHPVTAALYAAASTYFSQISQQNQRMFVEELKRDFKTVLPQGFFESEKFARTIMVTLESVSKTESQRKVKAFAKLLHSGLTSGLFEEFDTYAEYLQIIGSLSPREITILSTFHKHNEQTTGALFGLRLDEKELGELGVKRVRKQDTAAPTRPIFSKPDDFQQHLSREALIWLRAKNELHDEFKIGEETLNALANRLMRTGLISVEPTQSVEETSIEGKSLIKLSPLFREFKDHVTNESGEFF